MVLPLFLHEVTGASLRVASDRAELATEARMQFIDVTELVRERVRRSGVRHGLVVVHTKHTTTAVVVNENEPHLLEDLHDRLERWAPLDGDYRHNRLHSRDRPGERPNGHAHARAVLLGMSAGLNIIDGALELGAWQSIFFVELDGPRRRSLSILVLGLAETSEEARRAR